MYKHPLSFYKKVLGLSVGGASKGRIPQGVGERSEKTPTTVHLPNI